MKTVIDIWPMLAALTILLVPLTGLCLCYAIGADASARGASGFGWGAFALLPIAVPAYLLYRQRLPARDEPAGPTERRIGAFGIGGVTAYAVGSVVSPPDPISIVVYALPLLVVFVPLATRVYAPQRRGIST